MLNALTVATDGLIVPGSTNYSGVYPFSVIGMGFSSSPLIQVSPEIIAITSKRRVGRSGQKSTKQERFEEKKRDEFDIILKMSVMSLNKKMNSLVSETEDKKIRYVGSFPKIDINVDDIKFNKTASPKINISTIKIVPKKPT